MIELISFLISSTGLVLLSLLFCEIRLKTRERLLKKHRSHQAGLSDLLNYAAVIDDGVIVGKNGSLMTAWLQRYKSFAFS